jgi:hypothetical protein
MSNSKLVNYTQISPNKTSPRNHEIDTITIHCVVGQCTAESLGNVFSKKSRKASSNYGVDKDGRIGLYVDEGDRSWCSSNASNDHRAITIEVASDTTAPYAVNEKAYKGLIALLVDICKRHNIKSLKWKNDKSLIGQPDKQNITVHRWFANTSCPGEYLFERLDKIANDVNNKLKPEVIYRVQTGAYRNKDYAEAHYFKVKAAGFSVCLVKLGGLYKVQVGAFKNKKYAESKVNKLNAAGFDAFITTQTGEAVSVSTKKTVDQLAKEVIDGKWGIGSDRKNRLTKAGYDYAAVQKRVNELL